METKQDKPRICEVLGVEVGERFDVIFFEKTIKKVTVGYEGTVYVLNPNDTVKTTLNSMILSHAINHPECIVRRKRFTPQEIEDANAIKRLFPKIRAIRRDGIGALCIIIDRCEYLSFLDNALFPSINPGESYTLDEIIGDGCE